MNASMKALIDCMCRAMRELRAANGANVTVFFALATVPIVGAVGAAVDYSQANSIRTAMQAAADSTALMLAKDIGSSALSGTQISQKAKDYFVAMLNRPKAQDVAVTAAYTTTGGSQVTVSATAMMKTSFTALVGVSTMQIGVNSSSAWGGGAKMQVALALDNTGSMAEYNKIGSLKSATHALLDQLKAAASNPNDINVAIVPFAKDVNVGTNNVTAPWIDWTAWNANGSSSSGTTLSGSICYNGQLWQVSGSGFTSGGACTTSTGICYNGTLWNYNGSTFVSGGSCSTSASTDHSKWNGCVTDRTQTYDVTNTSPSSATPATLFPAEQDSGCPVAMIGLTNDWTALNSKVDAMTPSGFTNQAIGLAWAWQALSPGPPMNAPVKGPDVQKIIILLTDGLNTMDRWYTDWLTSQALIDARQKILCDNIKAAGITLYTIQVNIGNTDKLSTLLQGCASKPEYFYHLTAAGDIAAVFNKIGTNVSKLRIAR